jgi:hypothetical protein
MLDRLLVVQQRALRGPRRWTAVGPKEDCLRRLRWREAQRHHPSTRKSECWLMAGSLGRQCTTASIAGPSHHRDPYAMKTVRTLLLEDDPKTKERVISSILMTPTEVKCVPTLTAALSSLDDNAFDIIVIDRHLGGWVTAQRCKDLVARARGRPVVGLIDKDCVLDLRDGIEAGLTAVYYKDEMNFRLMRRLARLAFLPSVDAPLVDAAAPPFRSARSTSERARPQ